MINASDRPLRFEAVRDGRAAPVTCAACGCRLERVGFVEQAAWFHFAPMGGRDARGCRVHCAELAHDISGQP
jgi:hypothetical protein